MCDETSGVMDQPNIRNGSEPMAETFNTERLQKDLTAVKNDISALTEQLTDVLNSYADKASKQARQGYKQARSRADSLASDWSGVASDWQDRGLAAYEDARDAAYSLEESLEDQIQERPLAAVAIAAGIGFLIGAAWKK